MKSYLSFILIVAFAGFSCGGDEQAQTQPPPQPQNTSVQPKISYAEPLSPTEAFKVLSQAKRNRDAAAVKRFLSRGSLALSEKAALQKNQTLDEVILSGQTFTELPTRNEKITGDTATIEVQDPASGNWEEWFLIKEDGIWKNDLDRLVQNSLKRLTEAMKQPPPNSNSGKKK